MPEQHEEYVPPSIRQLVTPYGMRMMSIHACLYDHSTYLLTRESGGEALYLPSKNPPGPRTYDLRASAPHVFIAREAA